MVELQCSGTAGDVGLMLYDAEYKPRCLHGQSEELFA